MKHRINFFRQVDQTLRVGHADIEAETEEEAEEIFMEDIRQSDVANQEDYEIE